METIESMFKAVPIGLLIRSIFSGGFFVLSFYLAAVGIPDWTTLDKQFGVVIGASLFAGVLVYGIQRAIIYPFIERFFESDKGEATLKKCPFISEQVIKTAIWRWNLDVPRPVDNKLLNKQLTLWADHIHTQYSVVLCIMFGSFTGWMMDFKDNHKTCWPLVFIGLIFAATGFVNNWRHYAFIQYVKEKGPFVKPSPYPY